MKRKMKFLVWTDDQFKFISDNCVEVYTSLPWKAKKFDTKWEASEFVSIFPGCEYTILAIES